MAFRRRCPRAAGTSIFPSCIAHVLPFDVELIQALLDAGIAPDTYPCTEDEDDEPPLIWLARDEFLTVDDKIAIARVLLERGADIDEGGALEHAKEAEDYAFAAFLEAQGASGDR
jgi:hypothetical protein